MSQDNTSAPAQAAENAPMAPETQTQILDASEPMVTGAEIGTEIGAGQGIGEILTMGGPIVWILLLLSIIALSIILVKIWQFIALRPENSADIEHSLGIWRESRSHTAILSLDTKRPASDLVKTAMLGVLDSTDTALLREDLERRANLHVANLRRYLRPLEIIGTLSPLLGLLGTVTGMIAAFQQLAAAGNQVDPSVLSGGIWQALLTTAVGLGVAIPVVAAHSWLERKTERVGALINDSVTQVFTSPTHTVN